MTRTYARLYSSPDGESHFEDVQIQFKEVDFAPPAPPMSISPFVATVQCAFMNFAPGWHSDCHPAPRRQFFFCLSGTAEIAASDGEVRTFGAGDILLMEDTAGKGHASRVAGSTDVLFAIAQLSD